MKSKTNKIETKESKNPLRTRRMNKKGFVGAVIVAILALIGGYFLLKFLGVI